MHTTGLETFRNEFIADVESEALEYNVQIPLQFLVTVTSEMSKYNEQYPEANELHYEKEYEKGDKVRKLRVDGWNQEELEGCDKTFYLYVCDFVGGLELSTITRTEFRDCLKNAENFLADSIAGTVERISDASEEGYGLAQEIRKSHTGIDRYCIVVVTDRKCVSRKDFTEEHKADGGKNVLCRIIDIEDYYNTVMEHSAAESVVVDVMQTSGIEGIPTMYADTGDTDFRSYLCMVPGPFLAKTFYDYGPTLLQSNVRAFLGTGRKANKGMIETIKNAPQLFFSYNNGLTATATEVKLNDAGNLITEMTDLQIVNGGQTTVSIFNAWKKDNASVDRVYVQMKLTVASPEVSRNIVPKIAEYANTQSVVRSSDLNSNSEFQREMERLSTIARIPKSNSEFGSKMWFYQRTKNQFNQARASTKDKKEFNLRYDRKRTIDKLAFAKFRCLKIERPDIAVMGGESGYSVYVDMMEDKWKHDKMYFDINFFKETIAVKIFYDAVSKNIAKRDWYEGHSSIRNVIACYTVSKLFHETGERGLSLDLDRIWNEQSVDDTVIRQSMTMAAVITRYLDRRQAGGQMATQFGRKKDCWEDVEKLDVDFDEGMRNCCITKDEYVHKRSKDAAAALAVAERRADSATVSKSPGYWEALMMWREASNMPLDEMREKSLIRKAMRNSSLGERQVATLKRIISESEESGFVYNG